MTDPKNGKGGFSEFAKRENGVSGSIAPAAAPSPAANAAPLADKTVPKAPIVDAKFTGPKPVRK